MKVRRGKNGDEGELALSYAHRLIAIRLRTENELRERLKRKGFEALTVEKTIETLTEEGLLDDEEFAREYTQSKLRALWHPRMICHQLILKGVSRDMAKMVTGEVNEETLKELVRDRATKLMKRHQDLPKRKRLERVYSYFLRRGFSPSFLREILP